MKLRPLADTGMSVSEVALGCWPIAGLTSPGARDQDSIATIQACFDLGINHLDTAYNYGHAGESEMLIARALGARRDQVVIATKGGLCWQDGRMAHDASPTALKRQCEESLRRLRTDHVDLYYLHAPDPKVPIAESAGALSRLVEEGKILAVGVSNVSLEQLDQFAAVYPPAAYQPPYSMLQREIEAGTLPWCRQRGIAVLVYWPLLKGLLAGKLPRDHVFAETDSRRKYPMFHGAEWQKNCDLVDRLRMVAADAGRTVAQVVVNWTIHQPGVTAALCGAKRPDQLIETAGGSGWQLTAEQLAAIDRALVDRGTPASKNPV